MNTTTCEVEFFYVSNNCSTQSGIDGFVFGWIEGVGLLTALIFLLSFFECCNPVQRTINPNDLFLTKYVSIYCNTLYTLREYIIKKVGRRWFVFIFIFSLPFDFILIAIISFFLSPFVVILIVGFFLFAFCIFIPQEISKGISSLCAWTDESPVPPERQI